MPQKSRKRKCFIGRTKESYTYWESIGVQRLAEIGVSNAATATTKISGVAKSEGTGDIYCTEDHTFTTMNGLPIPSDNVNNKKY